MKLTEILPFAKIFEGKLLKFSFYSKISFDSESPETLVQLLYFFYSKITKQGGTAEN